MKKNMMKSLLVVLCIILFSVLVGCTTKEPDEKPPVDVVDTNEIIKIEAVVDEKEVGYVDIEYVPQNVVIYAVYKDNSKKDVTEEATFSSSSSKIGTSRVEVSYKSFSTSYVIRIVENTLESISVDISSAKLVYETDERLDTSNIIIKGKYANGNEETISHYRIELYLNGESVSDITLPGTYVVKVYVDTLNQTFDTSYTISVSQGSAEEKIYTRLELDTASVKTTFENEELNTTGLIVYGVVDSQNKDKLNASDYTISLYFNNNKVLNFEENGSYEVEVSYHGKITCLNNKTRYTVSYKNKKVETILPNITILSTTEAIVDIPVKGTASSINLILTDEDGNSRNLNQLENKLTDLDSSKFYSISGSYSTTLNEEEATFEITPIPFTTSSFEYFEQIEQEKTEENISANSISISLSEFENNVPAGYTLAGFEVLNSSEELMEDIPYTEELEGSLYITGLENNSSYLVRPYYHYAMALMSARETTYTYKIRFVGYWYLTRGSVNYRVRMRYNATTLYTWFVDTDHHYTNERFCTFILPNELEDYYIVGCYEDLSLITKDVDAEVVLALNENPNGAYTVAFYGFKDVLKKVEEVQPGESATAPELDSSIVWQSQTYDFTSFDREYTSVSSNLSVHANYILRVVKVKPNYYWSFRVGSESVYYMVELRNSASIISVTHTLKDLTSASPDQTIDNARYTSHWYLFDNLTPNTPYKFIINIKYDINDGNGEQEIVDEVEFTTITAEATGDVTGSIEERTHCDLTINMTGLESSFIFYSLDNLKFLVNGYYNDKYSGFCLNQSAPGTAYFYHKVQDSKNSNISYMYFTGLSYEVPEFDIPVFDENKTYLDLQNGCVLYINGEFTEELHITARFHYHVEEIMSTETLQTNLIWSNYDETLGNAYIPEFDVSKWLAEMFKYEGRLDSFVEIEYTINGTLYFKPLIFSFI